MLSVWSVKSAILRICDSEDSAAHYDEVMQELAREFPNALTKTIEDTVSYAVKSKIVENVSGFLRVLGVPRPRRAPEDDDEF